MQQKLSGNQPATITFESYKRVCDAYASEYTNPYRLPSIAAKPQTEDCHVLLNQDPVFVKQLDLVGWDIDDKLSATNDYIWAMRNRAEWSQDTDVTAATFTNYEEELLQKWMTAMRDVKYRQGLDDAERGNIVLSKCLSLQEKLEGREIPSHFTRGSFHHLADSKDGNVRLGWHPLYQSLLGLGS